MTAVAVSFPHQEKSVFRCILSKPTAENLATEARKRYENHKRWVKEKEEALRLEREIKRKQAEAALQEKIRYEQELRERQIKNQQEVQKWQEEKREYEIKRKIEMMALQSLQKNQSNKEKSLLNQKIHQTWLKNKLRQQENERKFLELKQKQEEEHRKSRKALAELSYEKWKERAKSITFPKNGFQIFGPKPKPVVLEEWVIPCQEVKSLHAMSKSSFYAINSFRSLPSEKCSEGLKLQLTKSLLDNSTWSLVPWGQRQGRSSRKSSYRTTRSAFNLEDDSALPKKKPPFR